ncbi:thiol-disulfide oxidoreductase DCC family protein [Alicyclobacillus macrosporangiidus]|uniref:Predicted thiol-disulfide oxidoreductase YuxK, DCC family n=1 Tax=Alicyclobacillus macrosporangiidus TaxID=392015 RepID=A0A1I7IVH8_9BACL|nr:DUF393 domain-containing protein [Alicyclobacillus macrosporangiidus]SFU76945.1 Predicted thiol-disulfide oxidoreductase YuxK, DCC family [Alicyclobacillus macrosporangiidus]
MAARRFTVLYDAQCPLCVRAAAWLRARDKSGQLHFRPAQDSGFVGACRLDPRAVLEEMHVVSDTGEVRRGADAVVWVMSQLSGYRWLGILYGIPGMRAAARSVYRAVAARRMRHPK